MDEKKMDEKIPVKRISGISFHKYHVKEKEKKKKKKENRIQWCSGKELTEAEKSDF